MSILGALKQQTESIDDLAKLPQVMIMQMAQRGQIREDMLAPILSRKAEMADAVARRGNHHVEGTRSRSRRYRNIDRRRECRVVHILG